ncbi:putative cyclin-dependent kinase F-2 [Lolium rigidum]|uniref:putative cyclin-dependent kinase F-2 n=1 Tax=Lolium rigidum TaxID=89674 RepID=UPI001F5DE238|nr:putative cyclin-dependent kinase F-2 [Lolium rigidum]
MAARKRPAAGQATTAQGSATQGRKRSRTDEYDDVACLGEGGFGAVVMARNRATGKTVAIKRLSTPSATSVADLQREAGFLRACSGNPYVVGFEALVVHPATGRLSLVMEHVAGPNLHNFLWDRRHGQPLPEPTVRAFMWKLLTGAKMMHARHVVHRDIKPANILVGQDGELVKICDLGLAVSMVEPPPYTQAGTPFYTAPEMLLQKPDYDTLVDTWSLGCVMAEMLAGGKALFPRGEDDYVDEISQLWNIIRVLGMPDERTWPGFDSLPLALALQLLPLPAGHEHNRLRDLFPEEKLSHEGFQVLQGLLTCNPDKRLTAAKALKHPWFAAPRPAAAAVALPRKKATPLSFIPPAVPEKNVLKNPVAMWNAQRV